MLAGDGEGKIPLILKKYRAIGGEVACEGELLVTQRHEPPGTTGDEILF